MAGSVVALVRALAFLSSVSNVRFASGSTPAPTPARGLFVSMYGEGSGNNKFLEITNGAAQSADLYACAVWVVSNGGSWYESSITLSGSLTAGASYRLASSSADSALTSTADLTLSITWNGDDAVGLRD